MKICCIECVGVSILPFVQFLGAQTNKSSTSSRSSRSEGTTEGSRARSRVLSVVARGSAVGGGERAGARVVSSDKEVTNCLARRAPGRPRDVLGTKLARRSRPVGLGVDRYRKTSTG